MRALWRAGVRTARRNHFFGSRHIVCQITCKNGAELKDYVKNRLCRHAGMLNQTSREGR